MTEVGRVRWIRGAVMASGAIALALGTARVSAAQTFGERLRNSRGYYGGTEGFV